MASVSGPKKIKDKGKIRWQLRVYDDKRNLTRPSFDTRAEALAEKLKIEGQQREGVHSLEASKHTLNEAIDVMLGEFRRRRDAPKAPDMSPERYREYESICNNHLRPDLGSYRLSEFEDSQMQIAQTWINGKRDQGYPVTTLREFRNTLRQALKAAVQTKRWLKRNPMSEHKVQLPKVPKVEKQCLTLDEICRLLITSMTHHHKEHERTTRARTLALMLQVFCAMRRGEVCGLHWEQVKLDTREIYVTHGFGVMAGHKTTKSGERFAIVPSGPVLHVALLSEADRREELTGPVLINDWGTEVKPGTLYTNFARLCRRAGLVDESGKSKYGTHALRHTCCSLWRAAGMELDDLQRLMAHSDIKMTVGTYLHPFEAHHNVRAQIEALGIEVEPGPRGVIEKIGVLIARRLADMGFVFSIEEPRRARQLTGPDNPTTDLELITMDERPPAPGGQIITVRPTSVEIHQPADAIPSLTTFRTLQRLECKRLAGTGMTIKAIARKMRCSTVAVSQWLREPEDRVPLICGRTSNAAELERRTIMRQRCLDMVRAGRPSREIVQELGVNPGTLGRWAREAGLRIIKQKTSERWRRCRELFAAGWNKTAIGRELGVSEAAVRQWLRDGGLLDQEAVNASWQDKKARVCALFAQGKTKAAVAREVGVGETTVSRWVSGTRRSRGLQRGSGSEVAASESADAAE